MDTTPAVPVPAVASADVAATYRRLRIQVFAGIFVGYAAYYLVRNNLALAIPDILREFPQRTKAELGTALTGLSIAYGVSKFLMGSVSDRSNPRYFFPLGLILSAAVMFVCGTVKGIYASLGLLVALQALNGWVQGMGWPPCGKTMVHWFSTRERGRTVSLWNVAHNIGGALVADPGRGRGGALPRLGRQAVLQRARRRRRRRRSSSCSCATRRSPAACRPSRSTATTTRPATPRSTSARCRTARSSSATC